MPGGVSREAGLDRVVDASGHGRLLVLLVSDCGDNNRVCASAVAEDECALVVCRRESLRVKLGLGVWLQGLFAREGLGRVKMAAG